MKWKDWVSVMVVVACAGSVHATTMLAVDVPHLARGADAIVIAKVLKLESRWTAGGARIVTDVELSVAESLKGKPGGKITVVQPGGVVGETGQRVPGVASFEVGEEVLVFLETKGPDRFLVSGMSQGKFRVTRGAEGALATPDHVDALLIDPATGKSTEGARRTPVKLESLRKQILAAIPLQPESPRNPVEPKPNP
jgi:hypothetical protein